MWPRTAFLLSYKDTSRKEIDGETRPPKEIDSETLPPKEIYGETRTPKEIYSEIFKNLPAEMRPKLIAAVPESHKK
jgi:hypothetical protein